tara:strand:- start:228 stop:1265 length:1038 start_codon:yes stop_codon:yes gene_type:complete
MDILELRAPDDWHCHLRDGFYLNRTVTDQARQFQRSIIMPNLQPPVTTVVEANAYRQFILEHVPEGRCFEPLMTLYLTPSMDPAQIIKAKQFANVHAVKLYPQGATTHSEHGVASLAEVYPLLSVMQDVDMVLAVHGEVTQPSVDIFDREARFLEQELAPIIERFPRLRIVLEHISSRQSVEFVQQAGPCVAATITPHHLLLNRNDLLVGGIKPHHYCLPIVKRQQDQSALIAAAVSGNAKFFLGTDSAPHSQQNKESACGCAGIYSAHAALELYAEVFEREQALHRLEDFASRFGAEFYRLPLNTSTVRLRREPWVVPDHVTFGDTQLVPFFAGQTLQWKYQYD